MKHTFSADSTMDSILGLIRDGVNFLREKGASPRSLFIGELVLEEILTNIMKYGFIDDPAAHQIDVTAEINDGNIALEFRDNGRPFDPLLAAPPKLGEPVKTQRMGGRGIYMVKKVVKESHYRREEGRNILTLGFPMTA